MAAILRRRPRAEPWSGRVHAAHQVRALRASAAVVDPTNRRDTYGLVRYRQPWQEHAWELLDQVGEFRYVTRLHGNSAEKIDLFPAVYMPGEADPVPIEDSDAAQYAAAAHDALDRLGGVDARRDIARRIVENFETVGECVIVGRIDSGSGVPREVWEIRSTSEVDVTRDGRILIRDTPASSARLSDSGAYEVQPDDVIARMWVPHPRYLMQADSTARSAMSILDELVILGKEVQAEATSRIATRGVFVLPDSWTVVRADGTVASNADDDPLMSTLIEAGTEAIHDPGSSAAAFPILIRAPGDSVAKAQHYTFTDPTDRGKERRAEALGRFATMANLPKEVLTGVANSNHWSGWLVDDQRWRDHLEPGIRNLVDAITASIYRRCLLAANIPDDVVARSVVWYDPAGAVVKSDRTEAARDAYDRFELSGEAYRVYAGFGEDEAPDDDERLRRAALKSVLDPASALAILQGKDPDDVAPPPAAIEPVAADEPPDDSPEQGPPNGGTPPENDPGEQPAAIAAPAVLAIPIVRRPLEIATPRPAVVAAAGHNRAASISRRLVDLDRTLRSEIRMAAEGALGRALEKTGNRAYSKVRGRDAVAAAAIRDVPIWSVPYRLGPALTAALGLDEQKTLEAELAALALLWDHLVEDGQNQAAREAAGLLGIDVASALGRVESAFLADRATGWRWLADRLSERMRDALTRDVAREITTASLVPTGVVRGALALAGGFNSGTSAGLDSTGRPVDRREMLGQIGTGRTIRGLLEAGGATVDTYEWVHGFSADPFEPHVALDGVTFTDLSDSALSTGGDFGSLDGWFPGDHAGCSCETMIVWSGPGDATESEGEGDE